MKQVDGSFGEGGGQVLRTALTMALATGTGVHFYKVRAGRKKPGLLSQHLTAVRAAAEIGGAETKGAELGSREVTFVPRRVMPGDYRFAVGSAGSATLVLQTVLPVLLNAASGSKLTIEGGTHNPAAPPFEFLEQAYLPLINQMGPFVTAKLVRPGYYPAGGGEIRVTIEPCRSLARLDLSERGAILNRAAFAVVSRLPRHIAERELNVVASRLSLDESEVNVIEETRSPGPGNVVWITFRSEHVTEVIAAFGQMGVKAEVVGAEAAQRAEDYVNAGVPVGVHLADQLLIPLALGCGGRYLTLPVTRHTRTNIKILREFTEVDIRVVPAGDKAELVTVGETRPAGPA